MKSYEIHQLKTTVTLVHVTLVISLDLLFK